MKGESEVTEMAELDNEIALVTGASRGIRRASDNLFATNVRSPFFLVQQLLPVLGEGSNIIVSLSLGRSP
jgi:NAD(P)-dependent dehydrogenase (short-subunit alcohol dehydrogenase family)